MSVIVDPGQPLTQVTPILPALNTGFPDAVASTLNGLTAFSWGRSKLPISGAPLVWAPLAVVGL